MGCDYYVQSDLVVVYYDNKGTLSTTRTNRILEKGYIMELPDKDSDDDEDTQYKKWKDELRRRIEKYTYKKILYEDEKWIKASYEKRYLNDLQILCPRIVKVIKIYKDYYAWERN